MDGSFAFLPHAFRLDGADATTRPLRRVWQAVRLPVDAAPILQQALSIAIERQPASSADARRLNGGVAVAS